VADITTAHFALYRDERLKELKPASVKRALMPIRNLFEVARAEWGLPIRENPLSKLKLEASDHRRERRLRPGEQDILAFAGACVLASAYGFMQGAWPFGIIEAIWAAVAVRRWRVRKRDYVYSP